MGQHEHNGTDEPVCPHCGAMYEDAWELNDNTKAECAECELEFQVTRDTWVTYSTEPINS